MTPKPSKNTSKEPASRTAEGLLGSPREAADQIDAILYFLYKRYAGEDMAADMPSLRTFLVDKMDIVFTKDVTRIQIEKRPEKNILNILTPPVAKEDEENRRIYLLSEFGELLIRTQREGYQQVREMLLAILDDDGKDLLIKEYNKLRKQRAVKKSMPAKKK
jgi:hypothetical protein